MSFRAQRGNETWRILPKRNKKYKTADFLAAVQILLVPSYACLLLSASAAEPARLQLSFNAAAANQVWVAACICSFLS
ncbi:hypothetical protein [Methanimicrococcus hongohii]|uniref:hypothetical protein n=1 Tax=Methanimicrococcus hongohii TaxID=3028295 RepID=UPI00292E1920|nr:hypothetical protein [Methanimicrococcus sp. Hf6]